MFSIQSLISDVPLADLRPAQVTVGLGEVEKKQKKFEALKHAERRKSVQEELLPAVKGPKGKLYLIDHHHIALSFLRAGVKTAQVGCVKDLSHLSDNAFWMFLDHYSWLHAYDARGKRVPFASFPKRLQDMRDDPFRSFASEVQEAGGFAKPDEPFKEFLWANFFRETFTLKTIARDRDKSLKKAIELAKAKEAEHLPGWSGTK